MVSQCDAGAWLNGLASGDQRWLTGSGSASEACSRRCTIQIHRYLSEWFLVGSFFMQQKYELTFIFWQMLSACVINVQVLNSSIWSGSLRACEVTAICFAIMFVCFRLEFPEFFSQVFQGLRSPEKPAVSWICPSCRVNWYTAMLVKCLIEIILCRAVPNILIVFYSVRIVGRIIYLYCTE